MTTTTNLRFFGTFFNVFFQKLLREQEKLNLPLFLLMDLVVNFIEAYRSSNLSIPHKMNLVIGKKLQFFKLKSATFRFAESLVNKRK